MTDVHAGFPILTASSLVPVVGALAVALDRQASARARQAGRPVASVATAALSIWLLVEFDSGDDGFQFVSKHTWIEAWGISWHLGVDGISLFLVVLTGVLFPLAIVGVDPHHDEKPYLAWLLLLEAGVMGSFLSLDLFVFFIFFEIVLVPMYFLIGGWGYDDRRYAALEVLPVHDVRLGVHARRHRRHRVPRPHNGVGDLTFDLDRDRRARRLRRRRPARWLFFAFAIAFAVKVPMFPLHTWLPDAHTQAPTAGSVILAGVMLKLGTYGLLRFGLYLFPEAAWWARPLFLTLAVDRHPLRRRSWRRCRRT